MSKTWAKIAYNLFRSTIRKPNFWSIIITVIIIFSNRVCFFLSVYIFSEEVLQNQHKRVEEINYDLMTYLIAIVIEYHYSQRIHFSI